jgi:hypothetical protein
MGYGCDADYVAFADNTTFMVSPLLTPQFATRAYAVQQNTQPELVAAATLSSLMLQPGIDL